MIKEDITPPLRPISQRHRFSIRRIFGQPHHEFLVIAPIAAGELRGGEFLHEIAGLSVEDPEESFVAEGGDFVADAVNIVDGVALGKMEIGLEGAGVGFGEGTGPRWPQRSG